MMNIKLVKLCLIILFVMIFVEIVPDPAIAVEPESRIKVGIAEKKPFVLKKGADYQGLALDIWKKIAETLNADYEIAEYASIPELLEAVKNGKVDCAVSGIIPSPELEDELDFSHFFFQSGLQIMTPAYTKHSIIGTVSHVISSGLLSTILGFILLMLVAAHIIWLIERKSNPDEFPSNYFRGIWESLWWSTVTVTTVGYGDKAPKGIYGRMFGLFWMVAGLFFFAHFTATVSSSLTVHNVQGIINGPSDLSGKRVAFPEGTVSPQYATEHGWKVIGKYGIDKAIEELEAGNVDAVVYDSPVLHYYAAGQGLEKVKVIGPVFHKEGYSIAFPLGSTLRKKINKAILILEENGILDKLYKKSKVCF